MISRREAIKLAASVFAAIKFGGPAKAQNAAVAGVSYGWDSAFSAPTEAWCHVAPDGHDDAAGTIDAPLRTIQAGLDRVLSEKAASLAIRGGIYREAIDLRGLRGSAEVPILIHRHGSEPVTVSAAEVLTGWRPCTETDARALGVSATGVYVLRLPRNSLEHGAPLSLNLHEAGQWLSVATERADLDRLETPSDDSRFFTATSIDLTPDDRIRGFADPRLKGLNAAQMANARLLFLHAPNVVANDPIAGFDPATGTIRLAGTNRKVQRENKKPVLRYALQNISTGLAPGRWLVREEDQGRTIAIYLRPDDPANLDGRIEASVRETCLDLADAAHVRLAGIEFVRAAGEGKYGGAAICDRGGASRQRAHDISFTHCRVGETFSSAPRGRGAVFLSGATNLSMRNCTVEKVRGSFGVALHGCTGADLRNLHLRGISQSAGRFFGARRMIFAYSLIEDSAWEAHSNKFNFYKGSDLVLVYGIRTRNTGGYVTYQEASRIHFAFCEFDASASNPDNRALVSQNRSANAQPGGADKSGDPFPGGTFWYWNLLLAPVPYRHEPARALDLGPGGTSQRHAYHNSILHGGGFGDIYQKGADSTGERRSHNLYTGLAHWQSARYNWHLGDHEAPIAPGERPRAVGRDMRDVIGIVAPLFPAFTDWNRDIDFRPVNWAAPPIGCSVL